MSRSGRSPKASSARRAVPNRLVTSGKSAPVDVGEEQRRAAGGDDPAMNLGGLEVRVDRRRDLDEIVVAAQPIEKRAKIGKHERGYALRFLRRA